MIDDTEFITTDQVAAWLHVDPRTVLRWVEMGSIPHLRFSPRTIRYRPDELREWAKAHGRGPR